ncbi:MAG: arginase family protein [Planctomycetota bacterium]|jgi:acetoin utilization protein AcuC
MRRSVFIHSSQLDRLSYPPASPLNTTRAGKTRNIVNSLGLLAGEGRSEVEPGPADGLILEKFHSARYLCILKNAAKGTFNADAFAMGIGTPDCPVFSDMYDYPVLACGGTLTAANLILAGEADCAFNPSGGFHHAAPELASGFCYINDVALACIILAEAGKKVFYLDVDVHHGDGVQNAFYTRSDVLTMSLHESGRTLFPGTGFCDEIGTGEGTGYSVNVPLPIDTYDEAYMTAFNALALPLITAFAPDVIVFVLGADALAGDPLGHLQLTNNTYADILNSLLTFKLPILMTGVGGYNVENTVRAWARAWCILSVGLDNQQAKHAGADRYKDLLDNRLPVSRQQRQLVLPAIETAIEAVKTNIFPLHGL